MAKILENSKGRRMIRLTTDDVISIVREYQNIVSGYYNYKDLRKKLDEVELYLPEEVL